MAKRLRLVHVRMTEKEFAMAESLAESFGDVSLPDVMRQCLRLQFNKTFPAYVRKGDKVDAGIPEDEITPEQTVEKFGGRIEVVEGVRMAVFKDGTLLRKFPMGNLELINRFLKGRLREEKLKKQLGKV